jgi:hypothetical protein
LNTQLLVHGIVQQTMVLIAQVATAGGVRAPLARVANQVFLDLTSELSAQGVGKHVIADMFGMALRTYHRKVRAVTESQTDRGRSVWEAVLEHVRAHEPVTARQIAERFRNDDSASSIGAVAPWTRSTVSRRLRTSRRKTTSGGAKPRSTWCGSPSSAMVRLRSRSSPIH